MHDLDAATFRPNTTVPDASESKPMTHPAEPTSSAHRGVLLVDDDELLLSTLCSILSDSGLQITTATSVEQARSLLPALPDLSLVVADHHLPGRSGLDFLGEIEQSRPHLGRLLLTGRPDIERVLGAVERGTVSRFFSKPVDPGPFVRSVSHLVSQARRDRPEHLPKASLQPLPAAHTQRSPSSVDSRDGGQPKRFRKIRPK